MSDQMTENPQDQIKQGSLKNEPSLQNRSTQTENSHSSETEHKRAVWAKQREAVDKIKDALNLGVDEGIKDTVVAFNVLGLNTTQSCEGHLSTENHGDPTPWIQVGAPNRPSAQFIDQAEVLQQVATKYGLPVERVQRPIGEEALKAYFEAHAAGVKNGETHEYQLWRAETNKLKGELENHLAEFYQNRTADLEVKLSVNVNANGVVNIEGGDPDIHLTKEEEDKLLLERRVEMRAFTEFLRSKFFS